MKKTDYSMLHPHTRHLPMRNPSLYQAGYQLIQKKYMENRFSPAFGIGVAG
jgi:hypothetical protein